MYQRGSDSAAVLYRVAQQPPHAQPANSAFKLSRAVHPGTEKQENVQQCLHKYTCLQLAQPNWLTATVKHTDAQNHSQISVNYLQQCGGEL